MNRLGTAKTSGESQHVAPLGLAADDDLALQINAVHLKYRLGNIETDRGDCLHE